MDVNREWKISNSKLYPSVLTRRRWSDQFLSYKLVLLLALVFSGPACAEDMQNYPSRPIKIITQNSPGGTSDVLIRALAERLHQSLGQPLVIEPRPGGQLLIAARACAEAPADGYTICFLSGEALVLNQALYKSWPEGFERNFAPVINVFFNKQMIVANASLGIRTLDGLAAVAKAKPKTLSYFAPGLQAQAFLAQFNRDKGLDLVSVPFRGGAEELAAILSGDTPIGFFGLQNFISYLQAGTLVGLAVDGKEPDSAVSKYQVSCRPGIRRHLWR